jgi:hypothetical protein
MVVNMNAARTEAQIRPDATNLRGIAHPVRLRILGLLRTDGPATAADMGRRLGLNTGATSYHLRKLARYGFVIDDPVRGARRERWWRAAHADTAPPDDLRFANDGVGQVYLRALAQMWSDDMFRAIDASAALPPAWRDAQDYSDYGLRLTPEEAKDLIRQVHTVLKNRSAAIAAAAIGGSASYAVATAESAAHYTVQIQMFPTLDDGPMTTAARTAAATVS